MFAGYDWPHTQRSWNRLKAAWREYRAADPFWLSPDFPAVLTPLVGAAMLWWLFG